MRIDSVGMYRWRVLIRIHAQYRQTRMLRNVTVYYFVGNKTNGDEPLSPHFICARQHIFYANARNYSVARSLHSFASHEPRYDYSATSSISVRKMPHAQSLRNLSTKQSTFIRSFDYISLIMRFHTDKLSLLVKFFRPDIFNVSLDKVSPENPTNTTTGWRWSPSCTAACSLWLSTGTSTSPGPATRAGSCDRTTRTGTPAPPDRTSTAAPQSA